MCRSLGAVIYLRPWPARCSYVGMPEFLVVCDDVAGIVRAAAGGSEPGKWINPLDCSVVVNGRNGSPGSCVNVGMSVQSPGDCRGLFRLFRS